MDNLIQNLLNALLSGGPHAIIAVLVLIIIGLLVDRHRLVKDVGRKDEKIEKIVDDYYRGNITLTDALNSLKNVLYEIRLKL